MISALWRPRAACRRRRSAVDLALRLLIWALVFGLAAEPAALHAQSRRRRQSDRTTQEKPKRRRTDIDAFSRRETQEEETGALKPEVPVAVSALAKAAYDAVIRSGRYILGPGDTFLVAVDRDKGPEIQEIMVGAEGKLVIPYVGAVQVAGQSLSEAQKAIREAIQRRFRHIDIDVTLSRLRTFTVNVLGEVLWPGAYPVQGVEQTSDLIMRAGGLLKEPEGRASLRNIEIYRISDSGEVIKSGRKADLALWRLSGEIGYNPFLVDGDLIFVPVRGDSISVSGAVQRPGSYEYAPGDRVADLVRLGGGTVGNIRTAKAELLRLSQNGKAPKRLSVDLARALSGDLEANLALHAGDKLYVAGAERRVTLEGEVRFPGAYPIEDGLTLKDLVDRAGGFTSSASLAQASVIREVAYRHNKKEEDIVLERLLDIPRAQRTDGEEAMITLKTQEVPGRLPVDFVALFERGDMTHNILLKDGDIVRVPKFIPSVLVNGSVIAPAAIPYDSTYTVNDYIARAGGFSDRARPDDVIVVQGHTGNSVKASKVDRIAPGDAIFVPARTPVPPGQAWRVFREVVSVAGAIASLILTITVINRQ